MSSDEIPKIEYLDDIQPDNAGLNDDVLLYSDLSNAARDYARYNGRRIDVFYQAEPGSVEELSRARQLGFEFFVATADKVASSGPQNRDLWAERYTNASIELFGAPDPEEATRLIARQTKELQSLSGNENVPSEALQLVLNDYQAITESRANVNSDEADKLAEQEQELAITQIGQILQQRYGAVFDLVDEAGKELFTQSDLVDLFSKALNVLAEIDDKAWQQWKVISPEKSTAISIHGNNQEVIIPKRRRPVSAKEARKLLAHELLVHGLRAKNGRQSSDERLLKGYPNYLDGEEGLAVIAGAAFSGEVSNTIHDRYADIALATGIIGKAPKKRSELYDLVYARSLVRAQGKGKIIDKQELAKKTSVYVDRIYRGSPGDNIGTRQAVYTADIYYYRGLRKVSKFIAEKIKAGVSDDDLFDYLVQGKFDPTDPMHTKAVGTI